MIQFYWFGRVRRTLSFRYFHARLVYVHDWRNAIVLINAWSIYTGCQDRQLHNHTMAPPRPSSCEINSAAAGSHRISGGHWRDTPTESCCSGPRCARLPRFDTRSCPSACDLLVPVEQSMHNCAGTVSWPTSDETVSPGRSASGSAHHSNRRYGLRRALLHTDRHYTTPAARFVPILG